MAWIESHQEMRDHPKTKRLARLLATSRPAAIGHLHCLWWWALTYAQDGNLQEFHDDEIAEAALWDGDPAQFSAALTEAGWLDPDRRLHDWEEYAGRLIAKRQANRDRMKRARAAHVQRTDGARAGATVPNQTEPNQEEEDEEAQPAGPPLPPPIFRWHDWHQNRFGVPPSGQAATDIDNLVAQGLDPEVVIRAVGAASDQRKRNPLSWALAVLRNMFGAGVRTLEAAEEYERQQAESLPPPARASPPRRSNVILPVKRKPDEFYEGLISKPPPKEGQPHGA